MSRKILYVGDVHATVEDLEDCEALISYICQVSQEQQVDEVVFLGDQYHNHSLINVHVMAFWQAVIIRLKHLKSLKFLVGNHDRPGGGAKVHALMAHDMTYSEYVRVVDKPHLEDGILYLPFYDNNEEFLAATNSYLGKTLVCHQTFNGAKYDNGFYAPDGIDHNLIPYERIFSGHIHTPQEFGKVKYFGAPRWRTLSDANIDRYIWLVEHAKTGEVLSITPFSTGSVCRQIFHLLDSPENEISTDLDPKHQYRIDLHGPAEWVEKREKQLTRPGVRIRPFKTTTVAPIIKESDGITKSFRAFMSGYTAKYLTPNQILHERVSDRLGSWLNGK